MTGRCDLRIDHFSDIVPAKKPIFGRIWKILGIERSYVYGVWRRSVCLMGFKIRNFRLIG